LASLPAASQPVSAYSTFWISCSLEQTEPLLFGLQVRFTEYQKKLYMQQMLAGLEYMHSMQLLHRDIKGAHIWLSMWP
jgi:serine/threonine protein kinase